MTDKVPKMVSKTEIDQPATAYRFKCLLADEPEKDIYCRHEGSLWVETPIGEGTAVCPHCERRMSPIQGRVINDSGHYVFEIDEVDPDEFRNALTPEFRKVLEQEREEIDE